MGGHLKLLRDAFDVRIAPRGSQWTLVGDPSAVERLVTLLEQLAALATRGRPIHPTDVRDAIRLSAIDPGTDLGQYFSDTVTVNGSGKPVTPRSPGQRAYVDALRRFDVVFGVGPAGTGKTYLAMAFAVECLRRGKVRRIVLTRPAVEAGEKLGFLPGDLTEKVDPYLRPLMDALRELASKSEVESWFEDGLIEIAPLAFMRGRTLSHAFVVLDEAQNTTVEQMKMFLTRLGEGGVMAINGDPSQVDLPRQQRSGLKEALQRLAGVPGIGVTKLEAVDVVRHPLVARIVRAWDSKPQRDRMRASKTENS